MGKNKNRSNQPKGSNMPDQDQDQSVQQKLADDANKPDPVVDQQSKAPEDTAAVQKLEDNSGAGEEDTSKSEDTSTSSAPAVLDLGTQAPAPAPVPEPVPTAAPVVEEVKPTTAVTEEKLPEIAGLSNFQKLLARVAAEGTAAQQALVERLSKYTVDMAPKKPQEPTQAISHQYDLWDIIKGVITSADNEEFRKQWFILLAFFHEHRNGALGGARVFRFAEFWKRDKEALQHKQRVVNIIHLVSDFENRKEGLKEVDLDRSLDGIFTEAVRNRLVAHLQQ